jgi:hypothetical protein
MIILLYFFGIMVGIYLAGIGSINVIALIKDSAHKKEYFLGSLFWPLIMIWIMNERRIMRKKI